MNVMDCREARQALAEHQSSQPLDAHVARCALCATLRASGETPMPAIVPWETIVANIDAAPQRWLQRFSARNLTVAAAMLAAALCLGVIVCMPAPDLAQRPPSLLALFFGAGALLVAQALAWHLRPLHRASIQRSWRYALMALTGILGAVLAAMPWPLSPATAPAFTGDAALRCFVFGWFVTTPVIGFLLLGERRPRPTLDTFFLGLTAAACLGMLALELHCPTPGLMHRLAGHATLPAAVLLATCVARLRRG